MTDDVKKRLIQSKTESVIIPGGCTKYVQAPHVVWNKSFNGISVFPISYLNVAVIHPLMGLWCSG